jgi:nitrate/nitrite transporter NarK
VPPHHTALATVSGIIDGTGAVGAAAVQAVVALLDANLGWGAVFIFLVVLLCLALVALSPQVRRETRGMRWRSRGSLLEAGPAAQGAGGPVVRVEPTHGPPSEPVVVSSAL